MYIILRCLWVRYDGHCFRWRPRERKETSVHTYFSSFRLPVRTRFVSSILILLGPQTRFGDKILRIIGVVCPQNKTAVLKGLFGPVTDHQQRVWVTPRV